MSNLKKNRQLFYSQLEKMFAGKELQNFKGKSGFSNLLSIKAKYFEAIQKDLEDTISDKFPTSDLQNELFQKLYTFFDSYLNETGSPYFNKTEFYKNLYEKVYTNSEDTTLFWKTQKLYYVKSDSIPKPATFEIKDDDENLQAKIVFDTEELRYTATNEKKELKFIITQLSKGEKTITLSVLYKSQKNEFADSYSFEVNSQIDDGKIVIKTTKDNEKKLLELIESYELDIDTDQIAEAIQTYKRQQDVDFFIHKDAESFLKEQFNLYLYNYLFKDGEVDVNIWDSERIKTIQDIKEVAFLVIEKIGNFEDELKAMWLKPKFVRNLNYIVSLDKLSDKIKDNLLKENLTEQIDEWKELKLVDDDFNLDVLNNEEYRYLPIDTVHLSTSFKIQLLESFDDLDKQTDGVLIKSDNFQALNTLMPKYRESIDLIYIDPPFNTGSDFAYKDRFQDSTWLTLMENRLSVSRRLLSDKGSFYLHLDDKANHLGKMLLNDVFHKDNYINEIIWCYSGGGIPKDRMPKKHDVIYWYANKNEKKIFNPVYREYSEGTKERGRTAIKGENAELREEGTPVNDWWTDIKKITSPTDYEKVDFATQKSEELLERIINMSSLRHSIVLDFFSGSGTTIKAAHKLGRKWIGVEMGTHFNDIIIPEIKKTLASNRKSGISKELEKNKKLTKGGLVKYYDLESYEATLSKAEYQLNSEGIIDLYNSRKLVNDKVLDKADGVKFDCKQIYEDIDIYETISNVSGWKIKQRFEDRCVYFDGEKEIEVKEDELYLSEYPFLRDLIWWKA